LLSIFSETVYLEYWVLMVDLGSRVIKYLLAPWVQLESSVNRDLKVLKETRMIRQDYSLFIFLFISVLWFSTSQSFSCLLVLVYLC